MHCDRYLYSLAPQIRQYAPGLFSSLKPLAEFYARAAGHRSMGLKYDDLLMEEREDVQKVSQWSDLSDRSPFICYFEEANHSHVICAKAISRLSEREQYDRAFRLRTAIQQSILHKGLPKEQWVTSEQVHFNFPSSPTCCRVDL
jgi:ubiquinol-cytochrome c reductase subunit 7